MTVKNKTKYSFFANSHLIWSVDDDAISVQIGTSIKRRKLQQMR